MKPEVSVVIPCYNEVLYIRGCVESLLSNGFSQDSLEIIIVDGQSNDGTLEVLEQLKGTYAQVKILHNPLRITPRSLNIGVYAAKGKYTLISSAHASFEKGYITTLLDVLHKNPEALAAGGVMQTQVKQSNPVSESIRTVLMHPVGVGNAMFRTGVEEMVSVDTVPFGIYQTEVLKRAGAYDERLIRNHDMELSKRILRSGGKILLTPEAVCIYYSRETFKAMSVNNYRNGKWNMKTVWITKTFSSLSVRHFIPLAFVGACCLPVLLAALFWNPLWFLGTACILLTYWLTLTAVALKARNGKNNFFLVIVAFTMLHFSYGIGSIVGLLSLPFTSRKT
jgi:glycosyltransferase involved in cell wall biosynthesis